MPGTEMPRSRAPRRRWPISDKRRIVELALRDGRSVRTIARAQGVHPNSLRQWMALYQAGKLGVPTPTVQARAGAARATFLPVTITSTGRPAAAGDACSPNVVQITLPSGSSLRIESGALDVGVLCALLAQLHR